MVRGKKMNSKIKRKFQKNLKLFNDMFSQMFVVHAKFHREITLVEGMPRKNKIKAQKYVLKTTK